MGCHSQLLYGDLTQGPDKVHDGVAVQLGGAREDPVHGDDHGLGAGLRQTLLVHLGLTLAELPQQGLSQGEEVQCRFRTFGQELVLDTSPDHLSKFQLGNTFEQLLLFAVRLPAAAPFPAAAVPSS